MSFLILIFDNNITEKTKTIVFFELFILKTPRQTSFILSKNKPIFFYKDT